jgi:A/G-specific adenine glycosylase
LLAWYLVHKRDLPWRKSKDPYKILVSELMLQQTQVKTVIPYYLRWMKQFPNTRTLAKSPISTVLKAWEGLGYYRRARMLHDAARIIETKHQGRFPTDPESIEELPGVGRYTKGAVASIAFDLPEPILDGNVIRVLARFLGIRESVGKASVREKLWSLSKEALITSQPGDFNQAMMELGALICTPRSPQCEICPVRRSCCARIHELQNKLPSLEKRKTSLPMREFAILMRNSSRILLSRRKEGWMKGLWQIPSVLIHQSEANADLEQWKQIWRKNFRLNPLNAQSTGRTLCYSVTNHRITMELFESECPDTVTRNHDGMKWCTPAEIRLMALSAAHRKVLGHFQ